jgi:hypothetical protein
MASGIGSGGPRVKPQSTANQFYSVAKGRRFSDLVEMTPATNWSGHRPRKVAVVEVDRLERAFAVDVEKNGIPRAAQPR